MIGHSLRTFAACIRRDWKISRSYRLGFLLELIAATGLLAVFYFIGRSVTGTALLSSADGDYFAFAAVGLALVNLLQTGLTAPARRVRADQTTGTLEVIIATSAPRSAIAFGSSLFDVLRALVLMVLTLVLAGPLFDLEFDVTMASAAATALATLGLTILVLSGGVLLAAITIVVKQVEGVIGLAVAALSLLMGALFPVGALPGGVSDFAGGLPLTAGVDVVRAGILDGEAVVGRCAYVFGVAVISVPVAAACYRLALAKASRAGTLGQY